jgi:hypothetical protein
MLMTYFPRLQLDGGRQGGWAKTDPQPFGYCEDGLLPSGTRFHDARRSGGEVGYRHADTTYLLRPGDALFFDVGAPHGPEKLRKLPTNFLSIIIHART